VKFKTLIIVKILLFVVLLGAGRAPLQAHAESTRDIGYETVTDSKFCYYNYNMLVTPNLSDLLEEIIGNSGYDDFVPYDSNIVYQPNLPTETEILTPNVAFKNFTIGGDINDSTALWDFELNENTTLAIRNQDYNYILVITAYNLETGREDEKFIILVSRGRSFAIKISNIFSVENYKISSIQLYKNEFKQVFSGMIDWSERECYSCYPYFQRGLTASLTRRHYSVFPYSIYMHIYDEAAYYKCNYAVLWGLPSHITTASSDTTPIYYAEDIEQTVLLNDTSSIIESYYYALQRNGGTIFDNAQALTYVPTLGFRGAESVNPIPAGSYVTYYADRRIIYYSAFGDSWALCRQGIYTNTAVRHSAGAFDRLKYCTQATILKEVIQAPDIAAPDWSTPGGFIGGLLSGILAGIITLIVAVPVMLISMLDGMTFRRAIQSVLDTFAWIYNAIYRVVKPVIDTAGEIIRKAGEWLGRNLPGIIQFVGKYWWVFAVIGSALIIAWFVAKIPRRRE